MCFPFFTAQGHDVGASLCEEEGIEPAAPRARRRRQRQAAPAGRPRRRPTRSPPTPRSRASTASTCPTAGWASTSARRPPRAYAEVDRAARAPSSGTARWARSSSSRSPPARAPSPRPSPPRRARPSSAAATPPRRSPQFGLADQVDPPLDRRRRVARAARGQDAARAWRSSRMMQPHARSSPATGRCTRRSRRPRSSSRRCCRASSALDGVDVAICAPFTALQAHGRLDARLARRGLRAEHARGRQGAFTGEVSAPMLDRARRPRRRARPLRAPPATSARPTARWPQKVAGRARAPASSRSSASARPRTSASAATPSASCATRSRRASSKSRARRASARSSIAYEPIWAIGTGRSRRPSRRRRRSRFVRALVADRDKEQAAAHVRILYGGSVKPDNAAELLALPDVDGALVGGASLDAADVRGDRRGARGRRRERRRSRRVCLVVLDGWGLAPDRARATPSRSRDTPVFDALWERYPHTTLTACGTAVGLPEGQMGNSEVGHLNLGAGAVVKQDLDAHRRGRRATARSASNAVLRAAFARRAARAPDRPRLRRRRALGLDAPRGADRHGAPRSASTTSSSTPSPTAATRSPHGGARVPRAASQEWCDAAGNARIGTRHRPLLRDGPRQPLGAHPAGLRPARRTARAEHHADRGAQAVHGRLRARRDRRVHHARRPSATRRRIRPGDTVIALQLPPRPHARDHAGARRPGVRPTSTAAAPPPVARYATLTEYEEGWPYPVAFPPAAPGDHAAARDRRRPAAGSCTSPRPRSTRT